MAQRVVGKEATTPPRPPAPSPFRLAHPGANQYSFPDGDPNVEDAPQILAIAGGAELWFDDYHLIAQNLLVWTDAAGSSSSRPDDVGFPYPAEPPRVDDATPKGIGAIQGRKPTATSIGYLREIYAEGDVYLTQGTTKIIQADKIYFNVIEERSLIVGGEIRTNLGSVSLTGNNNNNQNNPNNQPGYGGSNSDRDNARIDIVIRAAEIRGVAHRLYEAEDASITTSTFAKPGYHVAMDRMIFEERRDELGGRLSGYNNQFVIGDTKVASLDYLTLQVGVDNPLPLIGLNFGASTQYGAFIETRWGSAFQDTGDAFNRSLDIEGTFTGNLFADVNLYSARGLGLGAGVQYQTRRQKSDPKDISQRGRLKYFGQTEFFGIYDISGQDQTNQQDNQGWRGRIKSLNRSFLDSGWQLDTEFNLVSDRSFLRVFYPNDFDEEKVPETLIYLKKQGDDDASTWLARYRLNSWQTQTQYLPQYTYDIISRPVVEFDGFTDLLDSVEPVRGYWTHRTDVGLVDRQTGDTGNSIEGSALRIDDIERFHVPFDVGNFTFDPYLESRLTGWAGDGDRDGDSAGRLGLTVGMNASTQYWHLDPDAESDFWNIHGIRHIVIPSLRYRYTFVSTEHAEDLIPYDAVERFDILHAIVPGVDNRYQTKRMTRLGPETVEFLRVDVQQPFVFRNERAANQRTVGPLHTEITYRPDLDRYLLRRSNFRTSFDFNWYEASLNTFRMEFRTEPGPDVFARVAYSYADRGRISPTLLFEGFTPQNQRRRALNTMTFELAYQATRLWEFAVLQQFDITGRGGGASSLILRRRTADWVFEVALGGPVAGAGSGASFGVSPAVTYERQERERFRRLLSDSYSLTPIFEDSPYAVGPALTDETTEDDSLP